MKHPSKIRVLTLEGSPKERGRIHGESLKPMVIEFIERYKYLIKLNYHKDPDDLVDYPLGPDLPIMPIEEIIVSITTITIISIKLNPFL